MVQFGARLEVYVTEDRRSRADEATCRFGRKSMRAQSGTSPLLRMAHTGKVSGDRQTLMPPEGNVLADEAMYYTASYDRWAGPLPLDNMRPVGWG